MSLRVVTSKAFSPVWSASTDLGKVGPRMALRLVGPLSPVSQKASFHNVRVGLVRVVRFQAERARLMRTMPTCGAEDAYSIFCGDPEFPKSGLSGIVCLFL